MSEDEQQTSTLIPHFVMSSISEKGHLQILSAWWDPLKLKGQKIHIILDDSA